MRTNELRQTIIKYVTGNKQIYIDNLNGYIWDAKQNEETLLISESGTEDIICEAKDFWKKVGIGVMDVTEDNSDFKDCEYITESSIYITYKNRKINISIW